MCGITDPLACVGDEVGEAVAAGANNVLEDLFDASKSAAKSMIEWAFTWWIDLDSPDLVTCTNEDGGEVYSAADAAADACTTGSGAIGDLQDLTGWIVGAVAVGALAIAAARLAWSGRGEHASGILRGLFALLAAGTIGLLVVQVALEAGDGYSSWVVNRALYDGELAGTVTIWLDTLEIVGRELPGGGAGYTVVPVMIGLGLAIIAGLIGFLQFLLMLGRLAALVLIAGLLPVAAAMAMTDGGQATLRKYLAWLLGLLLYKPVAATIWAASILMMQGGTFGGAGDYFIEIMVAIMMMILALLALPALMRLIAPAVATVGSGGGGGGGMAALGTGATMAAGAAQLRANSSNSTTTSTTGGRSQGSTPPPQQGASPSSGGSTPTSTAPKGSTGGSGGSGGGNAAVTGAKVAVEAGKASKNAAQSGGEKAIGGPSGADDGSGR